MNTLTKKFPGQSLPDTSTCKKIGDIFAHLSAAHKAYSEAAEGLAELSTLVMPEQFTMLLTATMTPAIQLIVPRQLMSPLSTPPPPQPSASTAIGRLEIMNLTKFSPTAFSPTQILMHYSAVTKTQPQGSLRQLYTVSWSIITLMKPAPGWTLRQHSTVILHSYQRL